MNKKTVNMYLTAWLHKQKCELYDVDRKAREITVKDQVVGKAAKVSQQATSAHNKAYNKVYKKEHKRLMGKLPYKDRQSLDVLFNRLKFRNYTITDDKDWKDFMAELKALGVGQ